MAVVEDLLGKSCAVVEVVPGDQSKVRPVAVQAHILDL
jgi:hypothetical protein